MMRVIVSVYRASSATFEKVNSYQLPLFSSQGIYKSDYSQLNRKRLILCSISRPGPALRRPGEGGKETHHGEPSGALWGILRRLRGLFMGAAKPRHRVPSLALVENACWWGCSGLWWPPSVSPPCPAPVAPLGRPALPPARTLAQG